MAGAFTAVADDASAVYWNPAGLASGAIVSAVVDFGHGEVTPDASARGGNNSSFLMALSTPAIGVGYYRLRQTQTGPGILLLPGTSSSVGTLALPASQRVESLVTHHTGVTLVQSIIQGVAVGSTLKLVRGIASSAVLPDASRDAALDAGTDLLGRATNKFDLDFGVIAYGGPLKAGLTVRNVFEPTFALPEGGGSELALDRQARAGVAYAFAEGWSASADFDLTHTTDVFGERREIATGVEGKIQRLWVRSGLRFDTLANDSPNDDHRPVTYSAGGSYAVLGSILVDGYFAAGSKWAGTEWGVAARFVY